MSKSRISECYVLKSQKKTMTGNLKPMTELPKPKFTFEKTPGGERDSNRESSRTFKDALATAPTSPIYDET